MAGNPAEPGADPGAEPTAAADADPGASGEDAVLEILPDVELHHGEYSQSPSWQHLRVYGAEASAELDIVLRDFGFGEAEAVSNGFQCSKSEDPGAPNEP